jgi:hypothetical protein
MMNDRTFNDDGMNIRGYLGPNDMRIMVTELERTGEE